MAPKADPGEHVETALQQVQRWLRSDAPVPAEHPSPADFAGYVEWLLAGAPEPCPAPDVRAHAAGCRECYLKAEDLAVAHLRAEREASRSLVLSFALRVGREIGERWIEFEDEVVRLARRSLPDPTPPGIGLEARPLLLREGVPDDLADAQRLPEARVPAPPGGLEAAVTLDAAEQGFTLAVVVRHPDSRESIPGVTVRLLSARGKVLQAAVTGADSRATFGPLAHRTYRVEVAAP